MSKIKGQNYKRPAFLLVLMNLLGFGLLYVANGYNINIIYVGGGLLGLFLLMYSIIILCRMGDKFIVPMACMLITMGVILLCRIDIAKYGVRQIMWVVVGGAAFFVAYAIYYNFSRWNKLWYLYAIGGTLLFVITLLFGARIKGSKNWLSIGSFTFQPSEVTKILFVMFLACYFSKSWTKPIGKIQPKLITLLVTYMYIGFLVLQRDWGTILILFSIYIFMIYVYDDDYKFLMFNVGAAAITAVLGYKFLHHIQVRVNTWLNPWADISNTGYQITQSLFAIASGGYFGRGIGNGSPSYIPEVQTDFIFSAVCEEMGVFGGAAIIILFFLISYRCFKIAINTSDPFDKALTFGLTIMFAMQTFIIVGGVTKMIPLTGITLPFVSYGGTSIVVSLGSLGIIQAVSAKDERGRNGGKDKKSGLPQEVREDAK